MEYRGLGRTGWPTGGHRKDRELAESRSRFPITARFDMSNPENQRKLDAADVTLSVDILDRVTRSCRLGRRFLALTRAICRRRGPIPS